MDIAVIWSHLEGVPSELLERSAHLCHLTGGRLSLYPISAQQTAICGGFIRFTDASVPNDVFAAAAGSKTSDGFLANSELTADNPFNLLSDLKELAAAYSCDFIYAYAPIKLIISDFDSTLFAGETIDELARRAGKYEQVASLTHLAITTTTDFATLLRQRVKLLAGLTRRDLAEVADSLTLNPGGKELLAAAKIQGVPVAIASGSFHNVLEIVNTRYSFTAVHACTLEVDVHGALTGNLTGPIVDGAEKIAFAKTLARSLGVWPFNCLALGDGSNDLPLLSWAGCGIGIGNKKVLTPVRQRLRTTDLRPVAQLLQLSVQLPG